MFGHLSRRLPLSLIQWMLDDSLSPSAIVHVTNVITALIESNLFEDFTGSMVSILFRSIEFLDADEYLHFRTIEYSWNLRSSASRLYETLLLKMFRKPVDTSSYRLNRISNRAIDLEFPDFRDSLLFYLSNHRLQSRGCFAV